MTITIKYIGGPRAGKKESRGFITPPRYIVRSADELAAGIAAGHYLRKEYDPAISVAVYQWKPKKLGE